MAFILLVVGLCGLSIFIIHLLIRPTPSHSSLAKIPKAHWSASILPLWILWARFKLRENSTVQEAHEKFGPIVRLGPRELSINFVDGGLRTVYGSFEKHDWYQSFWNLGIPNMFSVLDYALHSERRRALTRIYSKTNLFRSESLRAQNEVILYGRLDSILAGCASSGQPLEIFSTMLSSTMDIVTAFLFGLSNSSNFLEDSEQRNLRLNQYQSRAPYVFYAQEMQDIRRALGIMGFSINPKAVDMDTEGFEQWIVGMCNRALQRLKERPKELSTKLDDGTVIEEMSKSLYSTETTGVERLAIASEMIDHTIAGHETSGIALTYLLYELSRNPHLQASLRAEVCPLFLQTTPEKKLPDFASLDKLPFLQACILETLRLHPPVVGAQARVTPEHGSRIGSYHVPGGVRISARASCLHQNPDVYPEPRLFRPHRWLDKDGAVKKVSDAPELYRWWWAFGSGGRVCLGNHFAMHDIKIVAGFIYARFKTEVVSSGDMDQAEGYIGGPKGANLMVKFDRLKL